MPEIIALALKKPFTPKDGALLAVALGFVLFATAPLAWMAAGAFKTTAGLIAIPPVWPDFTYFDNFTNLLRDNGQFLLIPSSLRCAPRCWPCCSRCRRRSGWSTSRCGALTLSRTGS